MNLQKFDIDIEELINFSLKEFPYETPAESELKDFVTTACIETGIGLSDAMAIASLLFAVWSHYNPREDKNASVCHKLWNGEKCRSEYIYTERQGDYIVSVCNRKHETKLLLPKTQ